MRSFNVVVERDPETDLYVGYVPGWPGAHSQGASLDELQHNLREVLEMLLEDGDPKLESEFVGTVWPPFQPAWDTSRHHRRWP
jgi:predicted RNase H-like HicB family nuclease